MCQLIHFFLFGKVYCFIFCRILLVKPCLFRLRCLSCPMRPVTASSVLWFSPRRTFSELCFYCCHVALRPLPGQRWVHFPLTLMVCGVFVSAFRCRAKSVCDLVGFCSLSWLYKKVPTDCTSSASKRVVEVCQWK